MSIVIQLVEPGVRPDAQESARKNPWQTTKVELTFQTGGKVACVPDKHGCIVIPDAAEGATVHYVRTLGPHRRAVRWQIERGRGETARPRPDHPLLEVALKPRLRLSLWSFNQPNVFSNGYGGPNTDMLELLAQSGIDDFAMVFGLRWAPKGVGGVAPIKGSVVAHWKNLIPFVRKHAAFHLGYAMGTTGKNAPDAGHHAEVINGFLAWLGTVDTDEIEKNADQIFAYLKKKELDVDGMVFDLEIGNLGSTANPKRAAKQEANLATLYQSVAKRWSERDGMVSYANFPAVRRDQSTTSFMRIQPYELTLGSPNLVARPMCYGGNGDKKDKKLKSVDLKTVKQSVEYALRSQDKKGAGIHSSQLQMALDQGVAEGLERYCKEVLRPNNVGLAVNFMSSTDKTSAAATLKACAKYNEWLNGAGSFARQPGEPLQVPSRQKLDSSAYKVQKHEREDP